MTIAEWTHLFPSRTQKLSTPAAKIARAKIARRQVREGRKIFSFFLYFFLSMASRLTLIIYKKQDWLKENNINSKSFYHWQKILREEKGVQLILDHTREQTLSQSLPVSTQMTDSSHIDFGVLTPPAVGKSTAVGAVLRSGDLEVEISDDISDDLLHRLIKAMSHD